MSHFAVIREAGSSWTEGKGTFDQVGVNDHAMFMNGLAADGFVLFAGPLAGSEHGRIRAMVIMDVADEAEIHQRLAGDPWTLSHHLDIVSIEQWNLFVGAERLAKTVI
ncbi:YciI family protein [Aeromicrobium sp.]|uniref:YciI family protein n=1 Tax=Aeromicrobium sp. TaxID=1871063 RepID=UPI003C6186EC